MNILILADHVQQDLSGGAQTVAWELSCRLVLNDHKVTYIVNSRDEDTAPREIINGIKISRISRKFGAFARIRERGGLIRQQHEECQVDLIHSHFAYSEIGGQRNLPGNIPWIRTFHGAWDEEGWVEDSTGKSGLLIKARLKRFLRRMIEKSSIKRANKIFFLSEFSRKMLEADRVEENRLRYAPGGCDVQRFFPQGSRTEARQRLGIATKGPMLLSIRRLVPRMGLDRLIDAVEIIRQQFPDVLLLLGGRGPEAESLSRQIGRLGLKNHVRMVGFIPDEQLADYYRAADLFVLPSLALEGFGLVTVDALACGTPVLGTPSGATPEILNRVDSRLVLDGSAVADIARGIERFFSEDWRLGLTPERLHEVVRDNYTWDLHFEAVMRSYDEVLAGRSGQK